METSESRTFSRYYKKRVYAPYRSTVRTILHDINTSTGLIFFLFIDFLNYEKKVPMIHVESLNPRSTVHDASHRLTTFQFVTK